VSVADIDTLKVSMSIDPINHRHFNFFLKGLYTDIDTLIFFYQRSIDQHRHLIKCLCRP